MSSGSLGFAAQLTPEKKVVMISKKISFGKRFYLLVNELSYKLVLGSRYFWSICNLELNH